MTQFVQDMMAANPAYCLATDPITRAAELMEQENCGLIPIVDDPNRLLVAGVITDRDIVIRLIAARRNPLEATVQDAMSGNVRTLPMGSSLREAADLMSEAQLHRLIITDENGKLMGVLSLADLATQSTQPRMVADTVQHISRSDT